MLAGLYHAQRGAHTYYLKVAEVPVRGDGVLNLIHYEVIPVVVDSTKVENPFYAHCTTKGKLENVTKTVFSVAN